jgi:hypothetical protein
VRLWSLHPSYLDSKGLVALWREGLLARKVLQDQTRGYRHHAQLIRFRAHTNPLAAIEAYLWGVYEESVRRGYHFDGGKLGSKPSEIKLQVTVGQLRYELKHLVHKLKQRDIERYWKIVSVRMPPSHPLFQIVPGKIEKWERVGRLGL